MIHYALREFVEQSPFAGYLEKCWNGSYYLNAPVEKKDDTYDVGGIITHALFFHIYSEKLNLRGCVKGRAAQLAGWLATKIRPDGYTDNCGGFSDHPAFNSTVADALGTAAYYARDIGMDETTREQVKAAFFRLLDNNPRIRYPEGAQGKTQQLRFELRVYYWAWLLTDEEIHKERFFTALERGLHRYTHTAAIDGPLLQPSMNPDWTWNYVCTGGITDEHSTNTHTPAYYCTEANGFLFVYLHGLKNGRITRTEKFDWFCRNYIMGLKRNLSRAGHLSSDLDGYGIHRAWYGPVLCEGIPLEAAAAAKVLEMESEWSDGLRWYVDRYIDFVKTSPTYAESGLPTMLPYGHKIGIEAQFSQLACTRFYGSLARALAEYEALDAQPAVAPVPYASYAWNAQWVRVSTPVYETSFAGFTCLRNIPVVPCYGDPHLGTLIGGSPVTTLMSGNALMYAASFPVAGLWHIAVDDHNGRLIRSCSTSPKDEVALTVRTAAGEIMSPPLFTPYAEPVDLPIGPGQHVESMWTRRERNFDLTFYVDNRYYSDHLELNWGMTGKAGHYYDRIAFCLPIPALQAEFKTSGGVWQPLKEQSMTTLPESLRWKSGGRWCQVDLIRMTGVDDGAKVSCAVELLDDGDGMPGGRNNFCPFRLFQVRIEIVPSVRATAWRMVNQIGFYN